MTYRDAMKWAVAPAALAAILVLGNGAYYYIDQSDRWRNSYIVNGIIGIPAAALLVYAVSFLCLAAVITLAHLLRKSPADA